MSQNLPAWFWSHCVKDEATVRKLATQLSIIDRDQAASQAGYDIKSCIYARLTDYLFGAGWNITSKDQPQKLVHNGLFLRLPDDNDSGDGFFVSVAAKLAAHFRTKLIAFDYQDIHDLAEHMAGPQKTYSYDVSQHYMSTYFPAADNTKFEKWMPDTTAKKWEMLTSFTSDFSKRKTYDSADLFRGMLSNVGNESAIIIILRSREFGRFWHPVCTSLRTAIQSSELGERVILIATDSTTQPEGKEFGPSGWNLNTRPAPRKVDIFPQKTASQETLFKESKESQLEEANKRLLQQVFRSLHPRSTQKCYSHILNGRSQILH